MTNAIGVTASVIDGNTLTITLGVTGDTAIDGANFVMMFPSANIAGVSLVAPETIPFGLFEFNDEPLGRFAFAGLGSTVEPGTVIYTLAIEFTSPPQSLAVEVSGESSEGDLSTVDVILGDGFFNTLPQGDVTITGTPAQGNTLTAANTLVDFDGLGTISYQWQADGVDIPGATEDTLLLGQAQVGKAITVEASYTDGEGNQEMVESAATALVGNANDAPAGVADQVNAVEDTQATFLASVLLGNDNDPDGDPLVIDSVAAVSGGTVSLQGGNVVFTPQANFNGQASFTYVASDGKGGLTAPTTVTVTVAPDNDDPTGTVTIGGTTTEGQTLTASNTLADVDGLGTITYQWRADGVNIPGATAATYLLAENEVGKRITVAASYTDGDGTLETVVSGQTATIAAANSPPTGAVLIQGTLMLGQTLEAVADFVDPDGIGSVISFQWLRDGQVIPGATGPEYLLGQDDADRTLRVQASYTDGKGKVETVLSQALFVNPENAPPSGAPAIDGDPLIGEQLMVDTAAIGDADGLGEFSYQWFRSGEAIDAATGAAYTLTHDDYGSLISVEVAYTDGGGTLERVSSPGLLVGEEGGENTPPTGLLYVYGDAEPGEILRINSGSIADADGLGEFSFQWRVDGEAVPGATGESFQLRQEDVGKLVTVGLGYTDGDGVVESLTSESRLVTDPLSDDFAGLIQIYVAVLGRAPAVSGLTFWSSKINEGRSFEYMAGEMWNSAGAREFYPPELSPGEQVTRFFENILNRAPLEEGLQFWTDHWETLGPVETLLAMIDALSSNNSVNPQAIADKILFQAKVDIGGYLAVTLESSDLDLAASAYEFLEAGNSVAQTVDYITQQVSMIGVAPADDSSLL